MFTRDGVYRVVKEAMGGTLAKLSVSALMFDYILTGPISGVSGGQYIVNLKTLFRAADRALYDAKKGVATRFASLVGKRLAGQYCLVAGTLLSSAAGECQSSNR